MDADLVFRLELHLISAHALHSSTAMQLRCLGYRALVQTLEPFVGLKSTAAWYSFVGTKNELV